MNNKILVIAPHPDDEVLGCGSTIAKHISNKDGVDLCIVTVTHAPKWSDEYRAKRLSEITKVGKLLGINKIYRLNLPTLKLNTLPHHEIPDRISEVIKESKPDILYIPHRGDINKDHQITFEAALVAARPYARKEMIIKILAYETPSETEWGRGIAPFLPNVYIDASKTFKKKLAAMKIYKSELKSSPHPRSLKQLEILARRRGGESGMEMAEAFMLVREINR